MSPDDPDLEPAEPVPCGPCRGAGTLISGLGGTPHEVRCAWCEGTGRFIAEHDAQEHVAEAS